MSSLYVSGYTFSTTSAPTSPALKVEAQNTTVYVDLINASRPEALSDQKVFTLSSGTSLSLRPYVTSNSLTAYTGVSNNSTSTTGYTGVSNNSTSTTGYAGYSYSSASGTDSGSIVNSEYIWPGAFAPAWSFEKKWGTYTTMNTSYRSGSTTETKTGTEKRTYNKSYAKKNAVNAKWIQYNTEYYNQISISNKTVATSYYFSVSLPLGQRTYLNWNYDTQYSAPPNAIKYGVVISAIGRFLSSTADLYPGKSTSGEYVLSTIPAGGISAMVANSKTTSLLLMYASSDVYSKRIQSNELIQIYAKSNTIKYSVYCPKSYNTSIKMTYTLSSMRANALVPNQAYPVTTFTYTQGSGNWGGETHYGLSFSGVLTDTNSNSIASKQALYYSYSLYGSKRGWHSRYSSNKEGKYVWYDYAYQSKTMAIIVPLIELLNSKNSYREGEYASKNVQVFYTQKISSFSQTHYSSTMSTATVTNKKTNSWYSMYWTHSASSDTHYATSSTAKGNMSQTSALTTTTTRFSSSTNVGYLSSYTALTTTTTRYSSSTTKGNLSNTTGLSVITRI